MKKYIKSNIYNDDDYLYDESADQWYNKESDWAQIIQRIRDDGYRPKYGMDNLVTKVILHFDSPESFGEYDPETGSGGYGDEFTLDGLFQFVEDSGGWAEFDYLA